MRRNSRLLVSFRLMPAACAQAMSGSSAMMSNKKQREVYVGNLTIGVVNDVMLRDLFNGALSHLVADPHINPPVVSTSMDPSGEEPAVVAPCLSRTCAKLAYNEPRHGKLYGLHCRADLYSIPLDVTSCFGVRVVLSGRQPSAPRRVVGQRDCASDSRAIRLRGTADGGAGAGGDAAGQGGAVRPLHQRRPPQGLRRAAARGAARRSARRGTGALRRPVRVYAVPAVCLSHRRITLTIPLADEHC